MIRLSDAILLGDALKKSDPTQWISQDGSCGCALGGALLATGSNAGDLRGQTFMPTYEDIADSEAIKKRWPWLASWHVRNISEIYANACLGEATIEDVVAFVRSVEPEDTDPGDEQVEAVPSVEVPA